MKTESYAFLGLTIFSSAALIIAITFFIIGACSLAPAILALLIMGAALLLFFKSLPKDKLKVKKGKKEPKGGKIKKNKKSQKEEVGVSAE